MAGRSVIVLRDREEKIRAFTNVCRHRMSTLLEGSGNTPAIVCPYHGWTYGLDGKLRGAPFMAGNAGFRKDEYSLNSVRCEEWLGWIYVTLDHSRPSIATELAPLDSTRWRTTSRPSARPMYGTRTWKIPDFMQYLEEKNAGLNDPLRTPEPQRADPSISAEPLPNDMDQPSPIEAVRPF